jgi:hypothetical protein
VRTSRMTRIGMSRFLSVGLMTAFLSMATLAQGKDPENAETSEAKSSVERAQLRGVWKVTELASRKPGEEWKTLPIRTSLYIFTGNHYSYMFVPGAGPRRLHSGDPNKPSDADKVAAYDSFVAASGTYALSGPNLSLTALLHKNPNEMAGEHLTYSIEISGDTLRMTIVNPPFSPGNERRTTLQRIE